MKKVLSIILCVVIVASIASIGFTSYAAEDVTDDYELGIEYSGASYANHHYFKFVLNTNSHVSLSCMYNTTSTSWTIKKPSGDLVWVDSDVKAAEKYNSITKYYSTEYGKNLAAGTYYLDLKVGYSKTNYSFTLDAEKQIKLPKGTLSSVTSPKKGQFVAKCKSAANALGYQFQYSLNERFKKSVKTVKSVVAKKTVKKLKTGKYYYVRVRAYTIYTDGTYVYGQYSLPKKVKIKK